MTRPASAWSAARRRSSSDPTGSSSRVLGQIIMPQLMQTGRRESTVPGTIHSDHMIHARVSCEVDLRESPGENQEATTFCAPPLPNMASASRARGRRYSPGCPRAIRGPERDAAAHTDRVGGVGKTRVALAVAERIAWSFADGTWLVELAPSADAALLAQTVASVVGVPLAPGADPVSTLVSYFRPRQTLLISTTASTCWQAAPCCLTHRWVTARISDPWPPAASRRVSPAS